MRQVAVGRHGFRRGRRRGTPHARLSGVVLRVVKLRSEVAVSVAMRRRFERVGHILPTLELTVVV